MIKNNQIVDLFHTEPFIFAKTRFILFAKTFGIGLAGKVDDTCLVTLPYPAFKLDVKKLELLLHRKGIVKEFVEAMKRGDVHKHLSDLHFKFLSGVIIEGVCDRILLGYSFKLDGKFGIHEEFYCPYGDVLDYIEEYMLGVKRIGGVIIPKRGVFDIRFFQNVKACIQEMTDEFSNRS